uniref:Mago-bind domain-containing protein n=1 Tax=Strongyloides stercoralis TaxID=6248 RepID=A0A0K0ES08_STRER
MSADHNDNNDMNNKPKKVYPKEGWPRDITFSDVENQDDNISIQNEQENKMLYRIHISPVNRNLNPILKKSRDDNGNKDKRQNRPKSVVFDLRPAKNMDFNYNISRNNVSSEKQNGNQLNSSLSDDNDDKTNDN